MEKSTKDRNRAILLIIVWILIVVFALSLLTFLQSFLINNPQSRNMTSLSWAGIIIVNSSQNQIDGLNASWAIPNVDASAGDGYCSTWIGIGGQLDKTLIQIGTQQDVTHGHVTYTAWYELLPNFAVTLSTIRITPGDSMTASINLLNLSTNQWNIQITDTTTEQSFSRNVIYNSTRTSDEWIVERPTVNQKLSNLADFGNITFSNCYANINNQTKPITNFVYSEIQMTNSQNKKLAAVSPLYENGKTFNVTYITGQ